VVTHHSRKNRKNSPFGGKSGKVPLLFPNKRKLIFSITGMPLTYESFIFEDKRKNKKRETDISGHVAKRL